MNEDKRAATTAWMNRQGQLSLEVGIADEDFNILQNSIGGKILGLWLAILHQQRAEAAIALGNAKLGTPEADSAAAVLQGVIRGVDQFRSTILDIADPQAADAAESQEQRSPLND